MSRRVTEPEQFVEAFALPGPHHRAPRLPMNGNRAAAVTDSDSWNSEEDEFPGSLIDFVEAPTQQPIAIVVPAFPSGSLDSQQISHELRDVMSVLTDGPTRSVVLKCRHLNYVGATVLGAFVSLDRWCQERGGRMVLAQVSPELKSLLELTQLHKVFLLADSVEAALEIVARVSHTQNRLGNHLPDH